MIIANATKDLVAAVRAVSDHKPVYTGTIYTAVRLESDDADNGKDWDTNDGTWQAAPVTWPTALHLIGALWYFTLPAAATTDKLGATIQFIHVDNLDESLVTTICNGGEHRILADIPATAGDVKLYEMEGT